VNQLCGLVASELLESGTIASCALRGVECRVGAPEQFQRSRQVAPGIEGSHPKTAGNAEFGLLGNESMAAYGAEKVVDALRRLGQIPAGEKDEEFFASDAAKNVVASKRGAEAFSALNNYLVAAEMAVVVINALKVVEVGKCSRTAARLNIPVMAS
jgi:hypothetical protein